MQQSGMTTTIVWPILLAIIGVSAVLFAFMLPAIPVGTWNDDATYIAMARSLAQGKGLSLSYLPTEPVYPVVPIGYPLLLAPLIALFPGTFLPLQLLSSVMMLAAIVLHYFYARPRLGTALALLAVALFATNVAVVQSAAQVMSEALFVVCILAGVLQANGFVKTEQVRWHQALLTAVLLALPVTVRYLGFPVAVALMAYVLWHRRDRAAVLALLLSLAFILVINLGLGGIEVAKYYVDRISGFILRLAPSVAQEGGEVPAAAGSSGAGGLARLASNVRFILTSAIPGLLVPFFHGPRVQALFDRLRLGFLPPLAQLGIVLLLVVGFFRQARRQVGAGEWLVVAYTATLFLLPTNWETLPSRFRYWIPLIPFGYVYLLAALETVFGLIASRLRAPGWLDLQATSIALVVVLLLLLNLGRDVQESLVNPLRQRIPDLAAGSEWLLAHSQAEDVVMVQTPRVSALYLERKVVPYPFVSWEARQIYTRLPGWPAGSDPGATLWDIVNEFDVSHILISPQLVPDQGLHWSSYVQDTLMPAIEDRSDRFELVWASADQYTRVYQIKVPYED